MQCVAQNRLVLTPVTHHKGSAVGSVMALQFGPQCLFLPWTGFAADRFDKRKSLFGTAAAFDAPAWQTFVADGASFAAICARCSLLQFWLLEAA